MFFGSRGKLTGIVVGAGERLTYYRRLFSCFCWSLHVCKGSSVENGEFFDFCMGCYEIQAA